METVVRFCGLPRNGSFAVWDNEYETFGKCFLWTAASYPCHAMLLIICAYLLGVTKKTIATQKSCLLYFMNILAMLLAVCNLVELILSYALKHIHPPAYVLSKTLSFSSWLLCFWVQCQVKVISKWKKSNNRYIMVAFVFVFASATMQFHYVMKHILSNKQILLLKLPADYYGVFVYFLFNGLFMLSSVILQCSKIKTTSLNRSIASLNKNNLIQNIDSEESINYIHDKTSSLLSSDQSQATFYETYKRHKEHQTDIYLGKAEGYSNVLSKLIFWWGNKLILKGFHNQIKEPDDLFILPDSLDTNLIKERFSSMLQIQRHRTLLRELKLKNIHDYQPQKKRCIKVSMMKSLNSAFGRFYYSLGVLKFVTDCLGFGGPMLLNLLVQFMENKQEPMAHGYYYAFGLFSSTVLSVILSTQYNYYVQKVGMQVRAGLITTIYEKTLSISSSSLSSFSTGQVMNYISTDTDRVVNFCQSFHLFWSLPFQIAISLYLLYQQVGLSVLSGLAFILVLVFANKFLAKKIGELSKKMMKEKDSRVKIISEILNGIRIIKLYAWEEHFTEKVNEARKYELKSLKGRKYLDALCVYFWAATPVVISILTFSTYVLLGHDLTAAKVFTSMALFNMLVAPLNAFPWVLNGLMEAWVSLKRIEEFLSTTEVNLDEYYVKTCPDDGDNTVLELENACFCWKEKDYVEVAATDNDATSYNIVQPFELKNISMFVEKGQFIGITGKVGSGKSSLFASISAEMEIDAGYIYIVDDFEGFAFVTQEPWLQHMSIRDNILFGRPYDAKRYEEVVFACALNEDINMLPCRDQTEVGENGVTLSGGQKARVALARAVYQDKEIYLLDDPLSAVDAHVASHLYNHCIMGLLKDKTRLLSTHLTKYLWKADVLISLEDGCIKSHGCPEEVLIKEEMGNLEEDVEVYDKPHLKLEPSRDVDLHSASVNSQLVKEEVKVQGVVSSSIYKAYWKSVGGALAFSILFFFFLMQGSRNVSDWWLAYWISHVQSHNNKTVYYEYLDTINHVTKDAKYYLIIYACLAASNTVFTFFRAFLFAYGGIHAAKSLHGKLLKSVLKAPISFFDATPIGRIMNRFSSDIYSVDDGLPFMMNIMLAQLFAVCGTVVITCYGVPWFTAILVPLGAVYYYTQYYYRKTSRELKRLSSVTLSPIYEHYLDTLSGLMTIRSFRESHRFTAENERKLDFSQRANYAGLVARQWLSLRLNFIGVAMITSVAFLAVVEHHFNTVNPGLVGLAISYALSVTVKLNGLISAFTETEKQMVSVERVMQYVDEVPVEEEGIVHVDNYWPQQGTICFRNVSLRYREGLPYALEDVSFYVKAGEKIGICGRTGSGKSSLFRLLFKTVQLGHGEIIIDGVNIKNVHIKQIRSQMCIIPQDPFLFDDTVAMNLDPKQEYTSFEMLRVLETCHLTNVVNNLGGLDGMVGEKGKYLSAGQKQLLCLARALLKRTKIICIDEATASVDLETDQLLQQTIQKEFASSTVLIIAHRIDSIINSDRVLVMDSGRVYEFAPPTDLLSDHESMFYSLVYRNN